MDEVYEDWNWKLQKKIAINTFNHLVFQKKLEEKHFDYFVFGHRHLPLDIQLNPKSKYINLGDWITHFTYGVFDGKELFLKKLEF